MCLLPIHREKKTILCSNRCFARNPASSPILPSCQIINLNKPRPIPLENPCSSLIFHLLFACMHNPLLLNPPPPQPQSTPHSPPNPLATPSYRPARPPPPPLPSPLPCLDSILPSSPISSPSRPSKPAPAARRSSRSFLPPCLQSVGLRRGGRR